MFFSISNGEFVWEIIVFLVRCLGEFKYLKSGKFKMGVLIIMFVCWCVRCKIIDG